jgi:hypothetical protein
MQVTVHDELARGLEVQRREDIKRSRGHINELIRLKCAPDLLSHELWPNAKEITESFAAYEAVARHVPWADFADPNVVLVAVGDGGTPRTAATFAFRSRWTCFSVDPDLGDKAAWSRIKRLILCRCRIEETLFPFRKVVMVCVHSHADLNAAIQSVRGADRFAVVAMPCCVKQQIGLLKPDVDYVDDGVWSDKRRVLVWRDLVGGGR